MTCLRLPLTLAEADAIIAACSGQADWQPNALLGLGAAALIGLAVLGFVLLVRAAR